MKLNDVKLNIGDKITITTPYGELFISIPYDDYGWNEELIRLSSDSQICVIPQASNSLELKLVGGHYVLNSVKLGGEIKNVKIVNKSKWKIYWVKYL